MSKKQKPKNAHHTPSNCVCFKLIDPQASAVFIAGSFNDWSPTTTPMISLGDGMWIKELVLPLGRYEYRLIVDGRWIDDPTAKETVLNPHGGLNAVLIV